MSDDDLKRRIQQLEGQLQDVQLKEKQANDRADQEQRRAASAQDQLKQVQDRAKAAATATDHDNTSGSTPAATPTVYLTRDRRLPKLRGSKQKPDDPEVEEWVADMRDAISSRPMKSKEAVEFILDHLQGEAKAEIRHCPATVREDPNEVLDTIVEVFGDRRAISNRFEAFYRRQQGASES